VVRAIRGPGWDEDVGRPRAWVGKRRASFFRLLACHRGANRQNRRATEEGGSPHALRPIRADVPGKRAPGPDLRSDRGTNQKGAVKAATDNIEHAEAAQIGGGTRPARDETSRRSRTPQEGGQGSCPLPGSVPGSRG